MKNLLLAGSVSFLNKSFVADAKLDGEWFEDAERLVCLSTRYQVLLTKS